MIIPNFGNFDPRGIGKFSGDKTIKVRLWSSDGRPTLEIRRPSKRGNE